MKFGHLIEYSKRNIFLQKSCTKWGIQTSPTQLSLNTFHLTYNKNKLYKTLDYWSRDMLNFDNLEKRLGIVSPTNFVYDFSR